MRSLKPLSDFKGEGIGVFDDNSEVNEVETEYYCEMNKQISEQEYSTLPDVPEGSVGEVVHHEDSYEETIDNFSYDIDHEILTRLNRLKLFSYAWSESKATNHQSVKLKATEKKDDIAVTWAEPEDSKNSKFELKATEDAEVVVDISAESDRLEFNRWYYQKIDRVDLATATRESFEEDRKSIVKETCLSTPLVILVLLSLEAIRPVPGTSVWSARTPSVSPLWLT